MTFEIHAYNPNYDRHYALEQYSTGCYFTFRFREHAEPYSFSSKKDAIKLMKLVSEHNQWRLNRGTEFNLIKRTNNFIDSEILLTIKK